MKQAQKIYLQNDNQPHTQQNAEKRSFISGLPKDTLSISFTAGNNVMKLEELVQGLSSICNRPCNGWKLGSNDGLKEVLEAINGHSDELLIHAHKYVNVPEQNWPNSYQLFKDDFSTVLAYLVLSHTTSPPKFVVLGKKIIEEIFTVCPTDHLIKLLNDYRGDLESDTFRIRLVKNLHAKPLEMLINRVPNNEIEKVLSLNQYEKQACDFLTLPQYMRDHYTYYKGRMDQQADFLIGKELDSFENTLKELGLREY